MVVMDSIRRSRPKTEWVLALHNGSLEVFLSGLAALLGIAALLLFRGRLAAARRLLVAGSGTLLVLSFAVLTLVAV